MEHMWDNIGEMYGHMENTRETCGKNMGALFCDGLVTIWPLFGIYWSLSVRHLVTIASLFGLYLVIVRSLVGN